MFTDDDLSDTGTNHGVYHGAYSADLHGDEDEHRATLTIAFLGWDPDSEDWRNFAAALAVWSTPDQIRMQFRDAKHSRIEVGDQLGRVSIDTMFDRAEALASPLKDTFFYLSDIIVLHDSKIRAYLEETVPPTEQS
jgi:hypothetical protein